MNDLGARREGMYAGLSQAQADARYVRLNPGATAIQQLTGGLKLTSSLGDPSQIFEIVCSDPNGSASLRVSNSDGSRAIFMQSTGPGLVGESCYIGATGKQVFFSADVASVANVGLLWQMFPPPAVAAIQVFESWPGATLARANVEWFSTGTGGREDDGGEGIHHENNAFAAPAGDPSSGAYRYASAGALVARGSGGTITTFAPA